MNRLPVEAVLQFSQDVDLRNLFELVLQCQLEDPDVQNSLTQRDWRGVRGNEIADDSGGKELALSLKPFQLELAKRTCCN